jgi:membrane-associated protease RseP (regulator of RpoE activity)
LAYSLREEEVTMARLAFVVLLLVGMGSVAIAPARADVASPPGPRFKLGITLDFGDDGPKIKAVTPGLAGAESGLQVGDVILGIDGRYAKVMAKGALQAFARGTHDWPVDLLIARGPNILTVHILG